MKKIIYILLLFYSIANFSQNNEIKEDTNIYALNGIEVRPEFPGGSEKLNAYINEGLLKAGFETLPKEKTRTVAITTFVVEKDGSLSDIKVLGKIDSRKSEAVIKILKSSPKWSPGKQNAKIVRVSYVIPL
ncbi:MAG: energy transducer TonB [Bacteroidota bacterium]